MDSSETYIKMADCPEIQSQRKRISEWDGKLWMFNEDGDFITNAKLATLGSERATRSTNGKNSPKLVWLPRQDQLQEMVRGNKTSCQLSSDFYWWHSNYGWGWTNDNLTSMEQLWMAFAMKENHNKTWSVEGWIDG